MPKSLVCEIASRKVRGLSALSVSVPGLAAMGDWKLKGGGVALVESLQRTVAEQSDLRVRAKA